MAMSLSRQKIFVCQLTNIMLLYHFGVEIFLLPRIDLKNTIKQQGVYMKHAGVITALLILIFSASIIEVNAQFGGGSGTSGDPYLISSVIHLNNIRGTSYLGKYYRQTTDLNLEKTDPSKVSVWVSGSSYSVVIM